MEIDKHALPTKLLWLDLEMTGLDPARDVILEVAAEITDFDFNKLASFEAVIAQPDEKMALMNEWSSVQHDLSGLTQRVRENGRPEDEVKTELANLIRQHFGTEPAVLAGNSIHRDRLFITHWWPEVDELLHYRMLDVSALKVYMQGKYGLEYQKREVHRAFDDIQESMAEWQYYLSWLQNQKA